MAPVLPPELWDYIIDFLGFDSDTLKMCSLVCHDWLPSCRYHLFGTIRLDLDELEAMIQFSELLSGTPVAEVSLADCVRDFRVVRDETVAEPAEQDPDDDSDAERLDSILSELVNVQHLEMEDAAWLKQNGSPLLLTPQVTDGRILPHNDTHSDSISDQGSTPPKTNHRLTQLRIDTHNDFTADQILELLKAYPNLSTFVFCWLDPDRARRMECHNDIADVGIRYPDKRPGPVSDTPTSRLKNLDIRPGSRERYEVFLGCLQEFLSTAKVHLELQYLCLQLLAWSYCPKAVQFAIASTQHLLINSDELSYTRHANEPHASPLDDMMCSRLRSIRMRYMYNTKEHREASLLSSIRSPMLEKITLAIAWHVYEGDMEGLLSHIGTLDSCLQHLTSHSPHHLKIEILISLKTRRALASLESQFSSRFPGAIAQGAQLSVVPHFISDGGSAPLNGR